VTRTHLTRQVFGAVLGTTLAIAVALTLLPVSEAGAQIVSSKREVAVLQTAFGKIVVEFYDDTAPKHVAAFKRNIRQGVYEGTTIHKIVPGFVIMGGDPFTKDGNPANDGWGGIGPPVPNEYSAAHKNVRGALGAPRKPESVNPDKAGQGFQFYIALADLPSLDASEHTVFGRVIEGLDIVDRIAAADRNPNGAPKDKIEFRKVFIEKR
jgi:cyclophilin family peptidyl-prolyl cis-trans isomerase